MKWKLGKNCYKCHNEYVAYLNFCTPFLFSTYGVFQKLVNVDYWTMHAFRTKLDVCLQIISKKLKVFFLVNILVLLRRKCLPRTSCFVFNLGKAQCLEEIWIAERIGIVVVNISNSTHVGNSSSLFISHYLDPFLRMVWRKVDLVVYLLRGKGLCS